MSQYTIELDDRQIELLEARAKHLNVPLTTMVQLSISDLISRPEPQVLDAVAYLLAKNAELYKRLA